MQASVRVTCFRLHSLAVCAHILNDVVTCMITFFGEKRAHARIKVLQTMVANRAGGGKACCSNLRTLFHAFFLPSLKEAYPDLQLYIREDRPASLEQAVNQGAIDCALTPDIAQFAGLDTNIICSEALTVAVPGDHPLSGLAEIPIDLLRGEKLLSLNRGFRLYDDVQALSRAAGAEFREDFEGTSLDALRQMVSIGMGLALFPAAYIASEFEKQRDLTHKAIEGRPMFRKIYLAWRRSSPRQEHFHTLLALARRTVEEMDVAGVVPYPDYPES